MAKYEGGADRCLTTVRNGEAAGVWAHRLSTYVPRIFSPTQARDTMERLAIDKCETKTGIAAVGRGKLKKVTGRKGGY